MILDLEEHVESTSEFHWISVLLENKDMFLTWLLRQETMTQKVYFDSVCKEEKLLQAMNSIVTRFEKELRKPRKPQRSRGYKDKGTLPDHSISAIRKEVQNHLPFTMLQLELEAETLGRSSEKALLRNFLTEGSVLDDDHLVKFRISKQKGEFHENKFNPEPGEEQRVSSEA
jgi:hypothetical protein